MSLIKRVVQKSELEIASIKTTQPVDGTDPSEPWLSLTGIKHMRHWHPFLMMHHPVHEAVAHFVLMEDCLKSFRGADISN